MTQKKPTRKLPKCHHDVDPEFPTEIVPSKGRKFLVGRCYLCGAIVALLQPKEGK